MSQDHTQWTITAGPGKFDLMLATFGEHDGPLTFTIAQRIGRPSVTVEVHVSGIARESGKDAFTIFGSSDGRQVVLWYKTKRSKSDRLPSIGFLEFRTWGMA